MGVLQCDRASCENIMCDRYSNIYGYICNDCYEELINSDVDISISTFMGIERKLTSSDIDVRRSMIENEFPFRYDSYNNE